MRKNKQGGARKGAGRKPLPDGERKVSITIYPQKKYVDILGGKDSASVIALTAIEHKGDIEKIVYGKNK